MKWIQVVGEEGLSPLRAVGTSFQTVGLGILVREYQKQ